MKDFPTFIDHDGKLTSQTVHMAYRTAASRLGSLNKEFDPKFHLKFWGARKLLCVYLYKWQPFSLKATPTQGRTVFGRNEKHQCLEGFGWSWKVNDVKK